MKMATEVSCYEFKRMPPTIVLWHAEIFASTLQLCVLRGANAAMITWSGDIDKLVINVRAGGHRHRGIVTTASGPLASLIERQTDHHGGTSFHHDGHDGDHAFDHFDLFWDHRADSSHQQDEQNADHTDVLQSGRRESRDGAKRPGITEGLPSGRHQSSQGEGSEVD
jgi:hypothetical protein